MALAKDLRELLALFADQHVEFLVVGAHAMAFHGKPRYTGDLDLFVRPSTANAERILASLKRFGFGGLDITVDDLISAGSVVQLGVEPNRIDLLTSLSGVAFDEAWENRVVSDIDGISVAFIDLIRLIANKRATGRAQDRADLESLGASEPPRE